MKKSLFFVTLLTIFGPVLLLANDENSPSANLTEKISPILNRSAFLGPNPPTELAEGRLKVYQPVVVSVVASLKSRQPERDLESWTETKRPAVTAQSICPNPISAFVKKSKTGSPYTFVVFPGSYATWKRGSFTSQTSDVLDQKFDDANIIAFPGYLSPAFLEGACSQIPWDGIGMAKDFFARINVQLKQMNAQASKTGLIGFSGGGFLAIAMLGHDAELVNSGQDRTFGLGAMAFSPILHARTAFHNLDSQFAKSSIDPKLGLTTTDMSNLWYMLRHLGPPKWNQISDLYANNPQEFIDRSFNEFTIEDLHDTVEAVGVGDLDGELTYENVYVQNGFAKSHNLTHADQKSVDALFDHETDVRPLIQKISAPLLIYFSQDDPVLSHADSSEKQPPVITGILNSARENKNAWYLTQSLAHTRAPCLIRFLTIWSRHFSIRNMK